MKIQLEQRVQELKREFQQGQQKLTELENEAANLRHTLLRISGAVQVLEEELEKSNAAQNGVKPASAIA